MTLPALEADSRLVIKANGRVVLLDMDNIEWVEAATNYVRLNVGKESYLFRETIGRISERLVWTQMTSSASIVRRS